MRFKTFYLKESFETDYRKFIAYHQTSKENADKIKRFGFNLKNTLQNIIWFTNNKNGIAENSIGANKSGAVLKLEVTINKAADWDLYDNKTLDELESLGYDGVILKESDETFDGFVFSPKQLKVISVHDSIEDIKESEEENYLNEASKELNIVSFLSDKISKTLDEIVRKPEQFKKYQPNNSGQFVIPFKKFIGDLNVPKNSFLKSLKYGNLFLDLGSTKDSTHPHLEIISQKDGKNTRAKAGGYYTNDIDPEIHLPFIDKQTYLPFQGYSKHWKSLLTHELTHAIQDFSGNIRTGTSQLSSEDWYSNKIEQEAILHQIYKVIQKYIKELFSEMKYNRTEDEKYRNIKQAVNQSNELFKWFESFESFKKSFRMNLLKLFIEHPQLKTRYLYLWDNHKDVHNKFLEDSYSELKKEFKNVIPTKELKYDKDNK